MLEEERQSANKVALHSIKSVSVLCFFSTPRWSHFSLFLAAHPSPFSLLFFSITHIQTILWTQMIPFDKLLSTSLLNFLLQHNGSHTIQHSDESIYTENCTVIFHIIMLTLQYRHTEINKTNISLNKVSVYLSFAFY